jgi:hypothetical protein
MKMLLLFIICGLFRHCSGSAALVKYGYKFVDTLRDARPLYGGEYVSKQCEYKCCKTVYKDSCQDHDGFQIKNVYKTFILRDDKVIECSKKYFLIECDGVKSYDNKGYTNTYMLEKTSKHDVIVIEMDYYHGKGDVCHACTLDGKIVINENEREKCTIYDDWLLIKDHHHLLPCPDVSPTESPTQAIRDEPTNTPQIRAPTRSPITATLAPSIKDKTDPTQSPNKDAAKISNDFFQ